MFKKLLFTAILSFIVWSACHHTTEQKETQTIVRGTVSCLRPGGAVIVHPAFITSGETYLTTTNSQGVYSISGLKPGSYELTGSALFCGDTTLSVQVREGHTTTLNFILSPDSATGKIFGEFQDGTLYQQRLQEDTTLANWTEKQIFEAATGATLQFKTLNDDVPDRYVFLGDSLMATADFWGQYYIIIPCGTYPLTGSCEGYKSEMRVVKVLPDSRNYINYILSRVK
jgi:hypothetical protein